MSAGDARAPRSHTGRTTPRLGQGCEGEHFTVGPRVTRAAGARPYSRRPGEPQYRPLRIYALDPAASRRDGAVAVVNVPYEPLRPGPQGHFLEIVNGRDDQSAALDLDDHRVLIQQGRPPSPTDEQFRRQMAYAVCSTTYGIFRQALGREVAWGFDRQAADGDAGRLRVCPAAGDVRNAYYDKERGELRFGVFEADATVRGRNVPRGLVYTCLSHDIVAHEMSHALLDGLRARFTVPSNPDVLAFHEAFADLVAVFQRFTYADVVRAGIRESRGDVREARLLTDIATQFGETTGMTSALRSAVCGTDRCYGDSGEPHELGEVLVAAVFEAFSRIYHLKATRLVRLATGGSGVLAAGAIPDGLADLLVEIACRLASHFLTICIRAIDYCPPVDITFGEYLRAVITADFDLVPDDPWGYREAWIDAFRNYGIYPADVPSLSEDSLLWRPPEERVPAEPDLSFAKLQFDGDPGRSASPRELRRQACALGQLVGDPTYLGAFGLATRGDPRLNGDEVELPVIESIRSSRRIGPAGQVIFDLVAEVTQRRTVRPYGGSPGFDYYGGSTIILDPSGVVRYVVRKSILNDAWLARQRQYVCAKTTRWWGRGPGGRLLPEPQPFKLVHEQMWTARPGSRRSGGGASLDDRVQPDD